MFVANVYGEYVIELVVNDGWASSAPDSVTVSFNNLPPVADAGTSQSAQVGQTVTQDGTGSNDPNSDALTYAWVFISVPPGNNTSIATPGEAIASFVPNVGGLYVVQLKVNDGQVDSEPSIIQIQVIIDSTSATNAVSFLQDAIAASDPDVFKNRNLQTALNNKLNAVLSGLANGDYAEALSKLQNDVLRKVDGCENAGAADKNDWIRDCDAQAVIYPLVLDAIAKVQALINSRPVANAGTNQTVLLGELIQLDGTASSDADNDPITYAWSVISQPEGSTATLDNPSSNTPSITPDETGLYVFIQIR